MANTNQMQNRFFPYALINSLRRSGSKHIYKLLQHEPITNTTYCGAHFLMVKTKEINQRLPYH